LTECGAADSVRLAIVIIVIRSSAGRHCGSRASERRSGSGNGNGIGVGTGAGGRASPVGKPWEAMASRARGEH